ncbi:MAG: Coenzyme F420 hydrogenase/dehydrogenase, beta subunit C-terminal domain [Candidatus Hodarchaeales archaeon]
MQSRQLRLENQVWALDRCAGCGMCVAACSRGRIHFESGMTHPEFVPKVKTVGLSVVDVDTCSFCDEMCVESCPRLKEWDKQKISSLISAKTVRFTSGNLANEIIVDLLSAGFLNGYIDAVLIMDMNRWTGKPFSRVVRSVEELYKVSGNQGVWTPILSPLYNELLSNGFGKVAIVGPPCVAQAVRCVSDSTIDGLSMIRNSIGISIATFCQGFYETHLIEDLASILKISPAEILTISSSVKEDVIHVKLINGTIESLKLKEKQKFMRQGCSRCTDYLGETADISVGLDGSPKDYATLIGWNPTGKRFIQNCVNLGLIETENNVDQESLSIIGSNKERRSQAQAFDLLQIYSLEALVDPNRLEDAKHRFKELFDLKTQNSHKLPNGCGSGCNGC